MDIIQKIIPNIKTAIPLSEHYIDKLNIYQKEKGKWYVKSLDSEQHEKLVFNEDTNKKAPEEIVRQLFLYELIYEYGYPLERIKIEKQVQFGREKKRADIIVYQNDNITPLILCEIKAPYEKNDIQQLKSYLNAEGSPIGIGFNGKNISRFIRPYPKEFEVLRDLPYEHEYQAVKNNSNVIEDIKEIILSRKWTLNELNALNHKKQFNLKEKIKTLEELVLANSGVDSFDEIFKLIYAKLYDEFEAENRNNKTLFFRDYSSSEITYQKINKLFDEAKKEWRDVFNENEKIKLNPTHLEIVIGQLTEIKLYGANLRIIDEAFEYLVPDVSKSKKGQYFTPRVVIDACVKIINPSRTDYIIDPSCGSAGFLLHAMEYVWDKYNFNTENQRKRYANKYLWGIDFEERTTKISRALMLIAGDGKTHIFRENTLDYKKWSPNTVSEFKNESLIADEENKKLKFDVVLSNPPFAGEIREKAIINNYSELLGYRYTFKMEYGNIKSILNSFIKLYNVNFYEDTDIKIKKIMQEINSNDGINLEDEDDVNYAISKIEQAILEQVENGNIPDFEVQKHLKETIRYKKNEKKHSTVERHILFIQRILDLLKGGGRTVIVLPQGIFNNANEKYVRNYISERARILGVIGLHGNSFRPHTGTKTSLLILRKYTEKELTSGISNKDYPIFFASSTVSFKDNSGNYLYAYDKEKNLILDEKHNPLYLTDLFQITEAFKEWGKNELNLGDNMFSFLED